MHFCNFKCVIIAGEAQCVTRRFDVTGW